MSAKCINVNAKAQVETGVQTLAQWVHIRANGKTGKQIGLIFDSMSLDVSI